MSKSSKHQQERETKALGEGRPNRSRKLCRVRLKDQGRNKKVFASYHRELTK
jgi:hypothetical protein